MKLFNIFLLSIFSLNIYATKLCPLIGDLNKEKLAQINEVSSSEWVAVKTSSFSTDKLWQFEMGNFYRDDHNKALALAAAQKEIKDLKLIDIFGDKANIVCHYANLNKYIHAYARTKIH